MDIEKQIEEILRHSENRTQTEAFQQLGSGFAIFFFTLMNNGMTRKESLELTKEYLSQMVFHSNQPPKRE